MVRRLLLNLSQRTLMIVLIMALLLPAVADVYATEPYPPMLSGQTAGSVTGRVTTNASQPMAGVTVYIANSASSNVRYASSTTDSNGYFAFAGVNSTNGAAVYRILATAAGYDDTASSAFSVSPDTTASAYVMMTRNYSLAMPTPTPTPRPGDITGMVKIENTTSGIVNAKVSLVKAGLQYVTITSAVTDSSGHFRFSGVEYLDAPGYVLRVEKDGYYENFTAPFTIVSDSLVTEDVYLTPVTHSNASQEATATPTSTATTQPSSTPKQSTSGFPPVPGFEAIFALAGLCAAYAVIVRK